MSPGRVRQRQGAARRCTARRSNALLDLANGLQILGELRAVGRPQGPLEAGDFVHHRVEQAASAPYPCAPLGRRAPLAEQAFEDHARMRLHRIRDGRRPP